MASTGSDDGSEGSVYDAVGGWPFFVDLVNGFYAGVTADPLLRPLYAEDLTDSRYHCRCRAPTRGDL